ncbi:MAG: hypothetical protein ABIH78_04165 [Candidatus Peregrinibacteria bacterium]
MPKPNIESSRTSQTEKEPTDRREVLGKIRDIICLIGVSIFIQTDNRKEPSEKKPDSPPMNRTETIMLKSLTWEEWIELTEAKIREVESGMENLRQSVQQKIDKIQDDNTRRSLNAPFEIIRNNQQYSERNGTILRKSRVETLKINIWYFTYEAFLPETIGEKVYGSFDLRSSQMDINTEYDPNNLLDNLVIYHELVHKSQQAAMLKHYQDAGKDYEEFTEFIKSNVIINWEWDAFAMMLLLMDLITNKRFTKYSQDGKPLTPAEIDEIAHLLNIREKQRAFLTDLINLGYKYFGHDEEGYKSMVNSWYSNKKPLFIRQNGKFEKVPVR